MGLARDHDFQTTSVNAVITLPVVWTLLEEICEAIIIMRRTSPPFLVT
jgi:hypothetical protein